MIQRIAYATICAFIVSALPYAVNTVIYWRKKEARQMQVVLLITACISIISAVTFMWYFGFVWEDMSV